MFSHLIYLMLLHYLAKSVTQKTAHWCFVRATQSNFCSALDFLSPEPCPKSPKLNALISRFRESYSSVSMSRESQRLKKSSSNWLNSGNALIQWVKNAILVFPVLPGSAEAQVIWGSIAKCLLIAYLAPRKSFDILALYKSDYYYYYIITLSIVFLPKNIKIRSRVSKL